MTEHDPENDPQPPEHAHELHEHYGILPADGVEDLTDQLTGYMNEIELGGLTDIIGQVLDDFLDQTGAIPEDLSSRDAFERIAAGQLAVTLAYQLGRLEGRSPQLVETLVDRAIAAHGFLPVDESAEISEQDLTDPKVRVLPRIRRMEYVQPQILQVQGLDGAPPSGDATPQ